MGHYCVYVSDSARFLEKRGVSFEEGELVQVTDTVPDDGQLSRWGLTAMYFGADAPDTGALRWCKKARGFVQKAPGVLPRELPARTGAVLPRAKGLLAKPWEKWGFRDAREWLYLVLTLLVDLAEARA